MPVAADNQHRRIRTTLDPDPNPNPNPSRSKPTISSLITSDETETLTLIPKKKKNFTSSTLRGLGCTASAHVSVPGTIRAAADWDENKKTKIRVSKKKAKKGKLGGSNPTVEVCCGPGIGLSTDAASVDCVVRRERGRLKIDGENQKERDRERGRERPLFSTRRMVNPEPNSFDSEHSMGGALHMGFDVFGGSRYHRHVRHPSPEGFAEIMMLQSSLMMGGRSERIDRYREWRLDVDHMSYEELLELGERIGHVNTGLKEDEIVHCLRKTNPLDNCSSKFTSETEVKCTICQEDYEEEDEIGRLDCGHFYHMECVKQWLARRNVCPICKTAAVPH